MSTVYLGNANAVAVQGDHQRVPLGEQITTVLIPDSYTFPEMLRTVTHADGLWSRHSDDPGPTWVESGDSDLAWALSQHYGCPIGRPPVDEGEALLRAAADLTKEGESDEG